MIEVHGRIHNFPREIKILIASFLVLLSIGFYTGLLFVNETTEIAPDGIEQQYLGNEDVIETDVMLFKKSSREILTLVHNHILSLSIIFFILALILSTTSINKKAKHFLMFEPFVSILLTFGGIYVMWTGVIWFKYIVMISGMLMTFSFLASTLIIVTQLFKKK